MPEEILGDVFRSQLLPWLGTYNLVFAWFFKAFRKPCFCFCYRTSWNFFFFQEHCRNRSRCVEDSAGSNKHMFCCCRGNSCNRDFRWVSAFMYNLYHTYKSFLLLNTLPVFRIHIHWIRIQGISYHYLKFLLKLLTSLRFSHQLEVNLKTKCCKSH